jgi:hypothetical protein
VLGFFLWGKNSDSKPPERGKSFSDYFEKQLGFTPEQVTKFHQLRDAHFENIRPYLKDVRAAKDSLFSLMRLPNVPDSIIEKAANDLAQKEKAQELQSFRHFRSVRELCNDEQKPKFDSLMNKIINRSFGRMQNHSASKEEAGKRSDK